MAQVLQSPPHFPSVSSSSGPCGRISPDNGSQPNALITSSAVGEDVDDHVRTEEAQEGVGRVPERRRKERYREGDQLSILTLLIAVFRKSLIGCSSSARSELSSLEIGWPSNVRHVAHVTFDRFNGFLGLPVEFEPEVPKRAPSASANVFGVSTESMQLSFDARGNSVPTILLLMQRHLYAQGGLQAEGIFRITAGNSQEEYVREQLNRGVVPDGVDVHCLAGLIKAWFRELPTGVLDPLSPEQVMQSQSEDECAQLVRLLPPTEAALLDWAINLMADVAQLENLNKMNAHNVAMVFAPNMTQYLEEVLVNPPSNDSITDPSLLQMADPLIALMYAVQVMNFLKTLVIKTLREREESMKESNPVSSLNSFDDDENQSSSDLILDNVCENGNDSSQEKKVAFAEEPLMESPTNINEDDSETQRGSKNSSTSTEIMFPAVGNKLLVDRCPCNVVSQVCSLRNGLEESSFTCLTNTFKCSKKVVEVPILGPLEKNRGTGTAIVGRINSMTELVEAWR